ncbi:hypothetical protein WALSEDRAFT_61634 [Wallemia mellicola CBS 633.66]|uniref:Uncharacterized protein n=1 Tax=Wallemia mellicola (strain ATCC MYA-4683 / CBS 633.66) TaxID=671144 RepID=I4Y578_WALMC|nr:hypothetical protein WALSEDRAFT_61634 [Wallemia mellicola CBS 633.66]EIM19120.1 hypothetical protein WALSEDRAFT_61634 [Wallemia mellicola CBS 633.66]|eukprot:XP_006960847.1 hypothetical protein WALSEDRAFT_61634 [Wallemia mellicola CBS 633.66]
MRLFSYQSPAFFSVPDNYADSTLERGGQCLHWISLNVPDPIAITGAPFLEHFY